MVTEPDETLLANWVGAFAVCVNDAQETAMACSRRAADVAVLQTLRQFETLSVADLAAATGLSHSATVRVVDRLSHDGTAARSSGSSGSTGSTGSTGDGRTVVVRLTAHGTREAARLQRLRLAALDDLLSDLDPADRAALARILPRVLGTRHRSRPEARHTCRFCDHRTCSGPTCPVGSAVHDGPSVVTA